MIGYECEVHLLFQTHRKNRLRFVSETLEITMMVLAILTLFLKWTYSKEAQKDSRHIKTV